MVNELIPAVYKQTRVPYGPHDLALMLIVLGIGCLVDLSLQPYNLEAQHYYRLARASIALQPVLGQQSVVTIKVVPDDDNIHVCFMISLFCRYYI